MFRHHHHHDHHGDRPRHAMRGFAEHARGRYADGGEGRGGRRRVFDGGELRLILLRLVADQPSHGYDLIRAIEARTGGAYAPSPGVVYPTLTLLGDMGQIVEQPGEGQRRVFAATDEGRRALDERADEVAALMRRLDELGALRARSGDAAVRRALHNLRAVLGHRLGDPDTPVETIHAAVALIDEAAQRIERL